MPRFHFHLRAAGTILHDDDGSECADVGTARAHAVAVAIQLMRNAGGRTRLWSMCVADEEDEALFNLFFADVAARLDNHPPAMQELAAKTCRRLTELIDVMCAARRTVVESHMLIARATGKPQLVFARERGGRPSLSGFRLG